MDWYSVASLKTKIAMKNFTVLSVLMLSLVLSEITAQNRDTATAAVKYNFDIQIGRGYDNLDYGLAQISPSLQVRISKKIFLRSGVRISLIESQIDRYGRQINGGSGLQPFAMMGLNVNNKISMSGGLGYEFLRFELLYEGKNSVKKVTLPFLQVAANLKINKNVYLVTSILYGKEMFKGGPWQSSLRVCGGLGITIWCWFNEWKSILRAGMISYQPLHV